MSLSRNFVVTTLYQGSTQFVRGAIVVVEEFVGRVIVGETFGLSIPSEHCFGLECDVGDECRGGAAMAGLDVTIAFRPALDAVKEVARVERRVAAIAAGFDFFRFNQGPGVGSIEAVRFASQR